MDELTAERFGPVIPYAEAYARPVPRHRLRIPTDTARENRVGLCGTDDLQVLERGGAIPGSRRARLLLAAIRRATS